MTELEISHAQLVDPKMIFSMYTESVAGYLQKNKNISDVVLFGIEVMRTPDIFFL